MVIGWIGEFYHHHLSPHRQTGLPQSQPRLRCYPHKIFTSLSKVLDGIDAKSKKPRKQLAFDRARRNYEQHLHANDALKESSTTVYLLVEELIKHL